MEANDRQRLANAMFESIPYEHRIESRIYGGCRWAGGGKVDVRFERDGISMNGATGLGIYLADQLERAYSE